MKQQRSISYDINELPSELLLFIHIAAHEDTVRFISSNINSDVLREFSSENISIIWRDAVISGSVNVLGTLIDRGLDIHHVNTEGLRPLHLAVQNDNLQIIRALLDRGIDINDHYQDGNTILHFAVKSGKLKVVKELIAKGAEITVVNGEGRTAMDLALSLENDDITVAITEAHFALADAITNDTNATATTTIESELVTMPAGLSSGVLEESS